MNGNHRPSDGDEAREARWTAYALGELDAAGRRVVESEVAASAEARRFVDEIRGLSGRVRRIADQEASAVEPSAALREIIEQRLSQLEVAAMETEPKPQKTPQSLPATKTRWTAWPWIAAAASACLVVAAVPLYFVMTRDGGGYRAVALSKAAAVKKEFSSKPQAEQQSVQKVEQAARDLGDARSTFNADRSEFPRSQEALSARLDEERLGQAPGQPAEEPAPQSTPDAPDPLAVLPEIPPPTGPGMAPEMPEPGEKPLGSVSAPQPQPGDLALSQGPGMGLGQKPGEESNPLGRPGDPYSRPESGLLPGMEGGGQAASRPRHDRIMENQPSGQESHTFGFTGKEQTTSERPMSEGDLEAPRIASDKTGFSLEGQRYDGESESGWRYKPRQDSRRPAPGTEQYEAIVENDFLAVADRPQSTFSIDVDTASYANLRRFLTRGMLPPPAAVRIEEMLNYFKYDYPLPQGDAPFSVTMEVAQCPWQSGHRLLRVGLKGDEIDRKQRGLSNLVFLLDVSGSMSDRSKLPLVKQAMRLLVEQLDENDRVAIVTYAGTTAVHLESTNGQNREKIIEAIDRLSPGGSTAGAAGLQLASQQAVQYFIKDGTNRVLLCTDGDLNVGITRDDELVKLITERAKSGVFLTVMGFGTGNLKDAKLEKLADHGNGIYAYIDSLREARKVLVEQLTGSLITIAKDVKLQIEFNPAEVKSYRLIGYENRVMAARDFHDDTKDAGEIGAGHTVTALYELVPADSDGDDTPAEEKAPAETAGKLKYQKGPAVRLTKAANSGELLTLSLRYKKPDEDQSKLLEFTAKDSDKRIGEASGDFQFAAGVAAFGMILRNSAHRGQATLSAVEEIAGSAVGDDTGGYRAEFLDLVRKAKQLRR